MPEPASSLNLLIAVTGGPGASKTSLLAELVAAQLARGHRVEGVLALAGQRSSPNKGADDYWLKIIGTDQELSWAVRDESTNPPYVFEPGTGRKLAQWAENLRTLPPPPLLILDEFGKFELKGLGLMPLWPTLVATRPHIVVVAVRADLADEVEKLLGQPFDIRIPAGSPDALPQLIRACEDYGEWTRLGLYGGAAGAVEVTVGSALHAAKIPFSGLFLSSTQSAMMVYAGTGLSQPGRVVWVPFISGGLKALSPAGNRVRPMIAIIMQGLLFGSSVQLLGWNIFGVAIGGALIGTWAALQSLVLQYLLIGKDLFKAYDSVLAWFAAHLHVATPGLPAVIGIWAALHALVACSVTLAAWRLRRPPQMLQKIIDQEKARSEATQTPAIAPRSPWLARLREFTRWQFWLPLAIVASILLGSGGSWEKVAWLVVRFVAVACVLMALLSVLQPARWAEKLRRFGWWGPAVAMGGALRRRQGPK